MIYLDLRKGHISSLRLEFHNMGTTSSSVGTNSQGREGKRGWAGGWGYERPMNEDLNIVVVGI